MAVRNENNAHVYADYDSAVYVAPKGTALPDGFAKPSAAFVDLGWLGDDGIELDRKEDTKDFKAYQANTTIKRKSTGVDDSFKFSCLEEDAITMGLLYKGNTPKVTGNVITYTVENQTAYDERAWLIDVFDGPVQKRYAIPAGVATLSGKVAHKGDDMTVYEFTVDVIGSRYFASFTDTTKSA